MSDDHIYIEYNEIDDLIVNKRLSKKLTQKMLDRKNKIISEKEQEIKTLKEQLAEAVDVIRKCRNHNYLGGEAFLDRITEHFLEKQDKENKE